MLFMLHLQHLVKYLTHNRCLLNIGPINKVLSKINSHMGDNYNVRMENKSKETLTILF